MNTMSRRHKNKDQLTKFLCSLSSWIFRWNKMVLCYVKNIHNINFLNIMECNFSKSCSKWALSASIGHIKYLFIKRKIFLMLFFFICFVFLRSIYTQLQCFWSSIPTRLLHCVHIGVKIRKLSFYFVNTLSQNRQLTMIFFVEIQKNCTVTDVSLSENLKCWSQISPSKHRFVLRSTYLSNIMLPVMVIWLRLSPTNR